MKHAEQEASRLVSSQVHVHYPSEEFTPMDEVPSPPEPQKEVLKIRVLFIRNDRGVKILPHKLHFLIIRSELHLV